ncbi:MAG: putative ABC transporter permease [Clostridia bacterium]|nr:putative ABC transporter permease [Clostridia bacterium]
MDTLLKFAYIFAFCSTSGWVLELIYRSVMGKKIVNPGLLTGCCLPIYGLGGIAMYLICSAEFSFIKIEFLKIIFIVFIAMVVMTVIEFISGYVAIKVFNVRLWDYSTRRFNFKGIICPLFSIIWGIISLGYYFLLYPLFSNTYAYLLGQTWFILAIGFYFGVFIVDAVTSLDLMSKIKGYAKTIKQTVNIENIKLKIREDRIKRKKKFDAFMLKAHQEIRRFLDLNKNQ